MWPLSCSNPISRAQHPAGATVATGGRAESQPQEPQDRPRPGRYLPHNSQSEAGSTIITQLLPTHIDKYTSLTTAN